MRKIACCLVLVLSAGTIWADGNPFKVEGQQAFWTKSLEVTKNYFEEGREHKDGLIKEGAVIFPKMIGDDGRVFFLEKGDGYFFLMAKDLTDDPRKTERWELYRKTNQAKTLGELYRDTNKGKTLWQAVTEAAGTESYPALTRAILDDMVKAKIITPKEQRKKMKPLRLHEIMLRYSELVWD